MILQRIGIAALVSITVGACVSNAEQTRRALDLAEARSQLIDKYSPAIPAMVEHCVEIAEGSPYAPEKLRKVGFEDNEFSFRYGLKMMTKVGDMTSFVTLTGRSDGCSVFVLQSAMPRQAHRQLVVDALTEMGFEVGPVQNTSASEGAQKVLTSVLFGTAVSTSNFQTATRGDLSLELSNTVSENGYDEIIILTPEPTDETNSDR